MLTIASLLNPPQEASMDHNSDADEHDQLEASVAEEGTQCQAPKRTRVPYGKGQLREGRRKAQADLRELRSLVKVWKGFKKVPTIEKALAEVAEYIPTVREVVSQDPCLVGGETKSFPTSARAMEERRRRGAERAHFEELSRYYRLEGGSGQRGWRRAFLAKEVLADLKDRHPPPELANRPVP